jgi:hypothetical protein
MTVNRNHFLAPHEREALISLTTIYFIEEHGLLTPDRLSDAKKSLQALFLRTSGEETMLRRLIEVLKTTRNIHQAFASISGILGGVDKSISSIDQKVANLRAQVEHAPISAEAHAAFVGQFLTFSQNFVSIINRFSHQLMRYLAAREQEARAQTIYKIAYESRERLRQRLTGQLAQGDGEFETRIKDELHTSFDYGEAESQMEIAARHSQAMERDVLDALKQMQGLCYAAMNPALRDRLVEIPAEEDIFKSFAHAVSKYKDLETIKDPTQQLFKLYQHAHGMFQLDYDKLKRALETMRDNTGVYFQAKEEDRDLAMKREKLRKIEGLIPFLEHSAKRASSADVEAYHKFSRDLSAAIAERRAPWAHIAEDLLRAKVQAEAEISTRL